MKHIHYHLCKSTQTQLLSFIENFPEFCDENFLVSTESQTMGKGREKNIWHSFPQFLAFSCTLKPHPTTTLTSAETGLIIIDFFKQLYNIDLKLKWPNDILNFKGEKCGGILLNYLSSDVIVVGIGLNLFGHIEDQNLFRISPGTLFDHLQFKTFENDFLKNKKSYKSTLSKSLYQYLLTHRIDQHSIIQRWSQSCAHLGKNVEIEDGTGKLSGIFVKIGPHGEAIIREGHNQMEKKVYSGSLKILNN